MLPVGPNSVFSLQILSSSRALDIGDEVELEPEVWRFERGRAATEECCISSKDRLASERSGDGREMSCS